jgi:hypothetical protein
MRNFRHIFFLLLLCAQVSGCNIGPELHLRQPVQAQIVLETEVNLNLMWQVEWEAQWEFAWNVASLGPLGYDEPASISVHVYPLDENGNHKSHYSQNFYGTTANMPITVGEYDLLFHNNDSETLLFSNEEELGTIYGSTRVISSGLKASSSVLTTMQKESGDTKADDILIEEPVTLMPDGLFVLYDRGETISGNLEDYEYIDGKYVLRIQGTMNPATYIHLFQIHLLNNEGRVVGSNGGGALTGLAAGVDLDTRVSSRTPVCVPADLYYDRTKQLMAARFVSFGIPGCNPYDEESVANAPEGKHYLVLNITYANGNWKNIRIDVTNAFRALPLGGLIDLTLDVNDFPPEEGTPGSGGGFDALIDEWDEEHGEATIIF